MILMQLKPHQKDLGGGMVVRRVLPAHDKPAVGPFIFFDHFGPDDVPAHAQRDVRAHPHIGLATVTYLFEGAMDHRDSVGSVQRITPGAINWMTAGSGIVHSERTPADLKPHSHRSHGLQLWCGLPAECEETAPAFVHTPADAIPVLQREGLTCRVLIGSAFGLESPVATFTTTLYLDIALAPGVPLVLDDLPEEAAVYAVQGSLSVNDIALEDGAMGVLDTQQPVTISSHDGCRLVVIGGAALGHRFMWWNFVSSRRERIVQASEDWAAQRFAAVPGETEFIPLPSTRFAG